MAARGIPNPKAGGSNPSGVRKIHFEIFFSFLIIRLVGPLCRPGREDAMAQWQRVGFQIPRLGVRVPLASGTSVTFGSSFMLPAGPATRCRSSVPVAQLDKASDYESEDWGFESLQG